MKKIDILLTAFLILIIIVFTAYSTVMTYDRQKRDALFDDYFILQQKMILDDVYTEYMELRTDVDSCTIIEKQIESSIEVSNHLVNRLKAINQYGIVPSDNRIKYTFILTNIRLWLQQQKFEKECGIEKNIILYFYPEVFESDVEKAKLDTKTIFFENKISSLRKKCNIDGLVSLPYLDNIPILNQLIKDFDIKESPALVINNKVYYDKDIPSEITEQFLRKIGC